jgi:hypothetical protein
MTGWAVDVDMSERLLEVEVFKDNDGGKMRCYVPCKPRCCSRVARSWIELIVVDFGVMGGQMTS